MSLIPPLPATGRVLPTKVVVRLLPPSLTDLVVPEEFYKAVEWVKFVPGNRPENPSPENPQVNARLYVQFKSFQIASDFIAKFNGKVFLDDRGESFRAVAAFAPFQRVPRRTKQLVNALDGSLETNEHFQRFIEHGPEKIQDLTQSGVLKKDAVAPLVAAIAERNRRLNEQIEEQRAAKASKKVTTGKKVKDKPVPEAKSVSAKAQAKNDDKGGKTKGGGKKGKEKTVNPPETKKAAPPPPPPPPAAKAAPKILMKRPAPNPSIPS